MLPPNKVRLNKKSTTLRLTMIFKQPLNIRDVVTPDQLKEVQRRTESLSHYLDIESKKIEVEEEELRTRVADFRTTAQRLKPGCAK